MDKPLPNKIAQSFEQEHDDAFLEDHLPEGLWDQIAVGLNEPPMPEGHRVKASFEEQHDEAFLEAALPTSLWDQIEHGLDASTLPEGHRVKSSFEEQATPQVPNTVWQAVEEELEITTAWAHIKRVLDQRTRLRYWREKAMQGSLLVLALLWIRGCYWETSYNPTPSTRPVVVQTVQEPLAEASSNTQTLPTTTAITSATTADADASENNNSALIATAEAHPITTKKTPMAVVSDGSSTEEGPQRSTTPVAQASKNNTGTVLMTATSHKAPTTVGNASSPEDVVKAGSVDGVNTTGAPSANRQTTVPIILTPLIPPSIQQPSTASLAAIVPFAEYANDKNTPRTERVGATSVKGLSLDALGLPTDVDNPDLQFPTSEATVTRQRPRSAMRWELGLQARLSSSLFWGETTAKAMEATSMTTTEVQTTAGVGMVAAWHWSHRDAFVLSVHPSVSSRQYFGGYTSEGRYYHQQLTLTHAEGMFSYQRTLWRGSLIQEMPTRLYARVHYQLSHLTRGEELLNDELVEITQSYQRWQHSAGAALGVSHQFRRWVLDVGGYGSYGLSSVSTNVTPVANSRLIQWGGYVGVRYVL